MNSAISLENVKKTLGSREVLKGISFTVERGDIFGYLGPNGAGKTTTIRILLGLLQASSGKACELIHHCLKERELYSYKPVGPPSQRTGRALLGV